jgi:hypothetical protein
MGYLNAHSHFEAWTLGPPGSVKGILSSQDRLIGPPGFLKDTSASQRLDALSAGMFQWHIVIPVHRCSVHRDFTAHHHLGTQMVGQPGVSQAHCCLRARMRSPKGNFKRTLLSQSAGIFNGKLSSWDKDAWSAGIFEAHRCLRTWTLCPPYFSLLIIVCHRPPILCTVQEYFWRT